MYGGVFMDIKKIIEEIVEKIKGDKSIADKFTSDPVKTVEDLAGVDLPDGVVDQVVEGVKAKLGGGGALGGIVDKIKDIF